MKGSRRGRRSKPPSSSEAGEPPVRPRGRRGAALQDTDPGHPSPVLSSKSMLSICGHTDRGRVRESNEDSHAFDQGAGVAVVADGMGGHAAGEVASGMAAQGVLSALTEAREDIAKLDPQGYETAAHKIGEIISQSNAAILRRSADEADKRGMGTTLDAVLVLDKSAYVAHVGDSRVYWIREGTATPVTRDHSLAAVLVESGRLTAEE